MELEVIIATSVPLYLCVYGGGWVRFNWLELLRPELLFILEWG
jgi:hypothetical protein